MRVYLKKTLAENKFEAEPVIIVSIQRGGMCKTISESSHMSSVRDNRVYLDKGLTKTLCTAVDDNMDEMYKHSGYGA